jgi:ubiquinone/menaquinone biosynthesis C-methylase UbiE
MSFYADAQRYDLITGALSGAGPAEFYRRVAMQYGSPVLELACGSGRLSIPIARDGIEVVGIDASRLLKQMPPQNRDPLFWRVVLPLLLQRATVPRCG